MYRSDTGVGGATIISSTQLLNTLLAAILLKERQMLPLRVTSVITGLVGITLIILG